MNEVTENTVATLKVGETTNKSASSGSMYRLENNVIMGFVIRAGIFESMKQDNSSASPVIEVN